MLDCGFDLLRTAENFGALPLLLRRVDRDVGFVRVIEKRENPVIFFLCERIVFVIVALRALDGDAQNAFADGVHAVEHGFHSELLGVHAAFLVNHGIAQEARGDDLVLRGVRQQIARDLLDDELVIG